MRTIALSILLAAGAALASAASSQEAPAAPPAGPSASSYASVGEAVPFQPQWDGDAWRKSDEDFANTRYSMQDGVGALKAQDFTEAEEIFAGVLRRKQDNADANFYMGVTKMNLGEWEDAKSYLKIAAEKKPKHPDPKSRLGVTYAKLGDTAGAKEQRAALEKMDEDCKGKCRNAQWISGGIAMIDAALPPKS